MIGRKILSIVAIMGLGMAIGFTNNASIANADEAEKRAKDPRNKNYMVGDMKVVLNIMKLYMLIILKK